jgi:hypothetical protein
MTNNHLLFKALDVINKHKRFTESTTREFNEALIELGWVNDGWDTILTEQGRQILELLRGVFETW